MRAPRLRKCGVPIVLPVDARKFGFGHSCAFGLLASCATVPACQDVRTGEVYSWLDSRRLLAGVSKSWGA